MRRWWLLAGVVAVAAILAGPAAAGGNDPPLADAGLDQTVPNGTTVYLDAGGSIDPDGSVASHAWTVTGPDGTPVATACDSCAATQFTPTRRGTYTATVRVTDDDGATRSDTLYVTVAEPSGPAVTLQGPTSVTAGETATYTLTATADERALRRVTWAGNATGRDRARRAVGGRRANLTVERTFEDPGTYALRASVRDDALYTRSATLTVDVVPATTGSGGGGALPPTATNATGTGTGTGSDGYVTADACPDGVITNDGGEWWCRQTAASSINDTILDLGPAVNPDYVRWKDTDGTLYLLDREKAERIAGSDGLLNVSQMREVGHVEESSTQEGWESTHDNPQSDSENGGGQSNSPSADGNTAQGPSIPEEISEQIPDSAPNCAPRCGARGIIG